MEVWFHLWLEVVYVKKYWQCGLICLSGWQCLIAHWLEQDPNRLFFKSYFLSVNWILMQSDQRALVLVGTSMVESKTY